ncbi:MAG: cytochrome c3 family protein [Acidobacteria bacterium]|nr:cytochrome c3 family protein [Acidobacteriota bacterium]
MTPAAFLFLLAADVFPHARHGELNLKCTFCHSAAETKERASFPEWSRCKTCHLEKTEVKFPTRRTYRLPDFVFFSHTRHAAAKVECAGCHGEVKVQPMPEKKAVTSMAACVNCHREAKATIVCTACHELGQ